MCSSDLIILATNFADSLDPAVTRPGRIDLKIGIRRPTEEDAVEIFKIHLSKLPHIEDLEELDRKSVV